MEFFIGLGRYILPLIAFFIFLNCAFSLFKGNKKPGTIGLLINSANGDEIQLKGFETSIGRSNSCDIVVEYTTVSRFHAVMSRHKNGWFVTDTYSKTGTKVNDNMIVGKTSIYDGDTIIFGNAVFKFVDTKIGHPKKPQSPQQTPKLYPSDERFYTGEIWKDIDDNIKCMLINENNGETFLLNDLENCLIGRSDEAHIQIDIPSVSRVHTLLSRDGDNWRAEDLDSTYGTTLNGKQLKEVTKLASGDVLDVCGIRLVFKYEIT